LYNWNILSKVHSYNNYELNLDSTDLYRIDNGIMEYLKGKSIFQDVFVVVIVLCWLK
jgi:hypothetical protein